MTLLPQWSGIRLIDPARKKIVIHTDASGVKGIGGWWNEYHAFSTRLPRNHRKELIDWKEAYAVLFAFAKWGESWKGHSVLVMCDNTVVVNGINARSVHGKSIDPLQLLFLTAALFDIEVSSTWLSSKDNWIADALSRFELEKIADLFPQFQFHDNSIHASRESGKPMSELRARLQTFFGMDSLPILDKSIEWDRRPSQDLPSVKVFAPILFNSKRSHSSSPQQQNKHHRKRRKYMSDI